MSFNVAKPSKFVYCSKPQLKKKKRHSVKLVFQVKVQDLGLRIPGFLFRFPMASHFVFPVHWLNKLWSCFQLFTDLFCWLWLMAEHVPRTNLWCWGLAGQPASSPWGYTLFSSKQGCPNSQCPLGWSPTRAQPSKDQGIASEMPQTHDRAQALLLFTWIFQQLWV